MWDAMAKWTSGSHFITVVVILLVDVRAETAQNGNGDCSIQQGCQYKVNCSVDTATTCPGWVNETEPDTLDWVEETKCRGNHEDPSNWQKWKPCFTVFFNRTPANSPARLRSPWICATGHNSSLLSFRYAIAGPPDKKNCPLTVYQKTKTNSTSIWTSPGATKYTWRDSPNLSVQSPECPFQLVFEGKRTDTDPCGASDKFNYLSISDIVYEGVVPPPTTRPPTSGTSVTTTAAGPSVFTPTDKTTVDTAVQPETTSPTNVTTSPTKNSNQEPDNDTLGVGTVAGIGVGAVVIIACLIAVLIYVWRRRTRQDKTDSALVAEGTENSDTLQTVVNPGYQPENDHTTGSLPEESSSARTDTVTAETYEGLSPRPDSKFYTTLTTNHPASTSETYEGLAARPESRFYTDLATERTPQPDSTPENYELLTVTPEASLYTALTKSGHNMKKSK